MAAGPCVSLAKITSVSEKTSSATLLGGPRQSLTGVRHRSPYGGRIRVGYDCQMTATAEMVFKPTQSLPPARRRSQRPRLETSPRSPRPGLAIGQRRSTIHPMGLYVPGSKRSPVSSTGNTSPDATGRPGTALGARGPVQQRNTATAEPEPDRDHLHHASGQRTRLHCTTLRTVNTEKVIATNSTTPCLRQSSTPG
jgi:hypothetical protein